MISILPGRPLEWNSSASASVYLTLLSDMAGALVYFVTPAKAGVPLPFHRSDSKSGIPAFTGMTNKGSQGHGPSRRPDPDDGPVQAAQGRGGRRAAVLPHGRLLRIVLRRRQGGRGVPRHRA